VASATKTRIPGLAIALGLMACGPDEGARGLDTQLHDSAGIRIVENARPPEGSRLAWRIGPEPSLSIGVLEGDEPHMLFAVRDATRLADGRIVVANGGSAELRFGREPVWGVWGDLVAVGVSSRYEIKALEADGSLVRIVRREHIPREVTSAEVDAYIEGRRFFNEANRREYRSVPVAEHFPVFTSIMSDGLDHLWVREYDLPGEERGAPLWSVFDPEGRVLGFVETPAALTIYEIGPDYILGKLVSELGVESVQVWPLDRSGG